MSNDADANHKRWKLKCVVDNTKPKPAFTLLEQPEYVNMYPCAVGVIPRKPDPEAA